MKNFVFKNLVAACVAGTAIFLTPKPSVAQVDKSLLTEVASSCQDDVFSKEYYRKLGRHNSTFSRLNPDDFNESIVYELLSKCIKSRYFYSLILYKFPWLASTAEMLPGYPGLVAVSLIADNNYGVEFNSGIIDCLVSQDENSDECYRSHNLRGMSGGNRVDSSRELNVPGNGNSYAYLCPSCYVTYNNYPSGRRMIGAFMEWFMGLEASRRKELVSILGDEQTVRINRAKMNKEADKAWDEYKTIRQRIAEEEKERRRRELFE